MIESRNEVGRRRFAVRGGCGQAPAVTAPRYRSGRLFQALVDGSLQGILVHRGYRP